MKEIFGIFSLLVGVAAYAPYIRDVTQKKTRPHAFSWLIWALLALTAFGVQISNGAGAGSWLMGLTLIATLLIFSLSLKLGTTKIVVLDWFCLVSSMVALLIWLVLDQPLVSVVLITLIDVVGGFIPTFRKSLERPDEETVSLYLLFAISLCLSILALSNYTLINMLYPLTLTLVNILMVCFLVTHRKSQAKS